MARKKSQHWHLILALIAIMDCGVVQLTWSSASLYDSGTIRLNLY